MSNSSALSPSGQPRSNPSHLYMHANHHHHHNCYHYYDELELAAARACASILCAGNTLDYNSSRTSIVYTWLNQLLEQANAEMRMYDVCKCALPNEIYMLSMHVCVQLLDLTLHQQASLQQQQTTINFAATTSLLFEWTLHKCFGGISVEIADLCFIALARVYIDYLSAVACNGRPPAKNSFDHVYLAPVFTLALLNIGSSRLNIHETAIALLKAINKAFLQESYSTIFDTYTHVDPTTDTNLQGQSGDVLPPSADGNISKSSTLSSLSNKSNSLLKTSSLDANTQPPPLSTQSQQSTTQAQAQQQQQRPSVTSNFLLSSVIDIDIINSLVVHPQAQLYISEHMARKNPELTMFVIAELTIRMEQCTSHQGILFSCF